MFVHKGPRPAEGEEPRRELGGSNSSIAYDWIASTVKVGKQKLVVNNILLIKLDRTMLNLMCPIIKFST